MTHATRSLLYAAIAGLIFGLVLALAAALVLPSNAEAHRPVFLPLITASCSPGLLQEQSFEMQGEGLDFVVRLNPCSGGLQTRHFETSDAEPDGRYTSWSNVNMGFRVNALETWGGTHWRRVHRVEFRDFNYGFHVRAYPINP